MITRTIALGLVFAGISIFPASATAQSLGLGPRLSLVRSDNVGGTPATRFLGGTLRMRTSKRVAIELAMDYRTELNESGTTRTRERPFQGSLLIYPVRGVFSPYLLGGMGIYQETTDTLDANGLVIDTVKGERRTGTHIGGGAEIFIGRHAALFADYRFRFVKFGEEVEEGSDPIGGLPGLDKVSHRGSMWTSGMAFYF